MGPPRLDGGALLSVEPATLAEARALVDAAARIVVLTGAGVSAESGVPTFRGSGGLWKEYRAEELATPEAFARDPRLVWEWYDWRRRLVAECAPNPGHEALARLALRRPGAVTIVTQNVDGLHHRAARDAAGAHDPTPALPMEVHGAIHRDRCPACGRTDDSPAPVDATSSETLPRCRDCGSLVRPDVVWFGEALDPAVISTAFEAARDAELDQQTLVAGMKVAREIVAAPALAPHIVSEQIPGAALGDDKELLARFGGGAVVEVNLASTPLTPTARVTLAGPAGALLPALLS